MEYSSAIRVTPIKGKPEPSEALMTAELSVRLLLPLLGIVLVFPTEVAAFDDTAPTVLTEVGCM